MLTTRVVTKATEIAVHQEIYRKLHRQKKKTRRWDKAARMASHSPVLGLNLLFLA